MAQLPVPNSLLTHYHVVHIVVVKAPKYSVNAHYVCRLQNLFGTLAALVPQFEGRMLLKVAKTVGLV